MNHIFYTVGSISLSFQFICLLLLSSYAHTFLFHSYLSKWVRHPVRLQILGNSAPFRRYGEGANISISIGVSSILFSLASLANVTLVTVQQRWMTVTNRV